MKTLIIVLLAAGLLLSLGFHMTGLRGEQTTNSCFGPRPMSEIAKQGSCWWQRDQDNRLRDVEGEVRRFKGTAPR